MGLNFYAGCHRCKEKVFLYRGKESIVMHKFFKKHSDCIRINNNACVVVGDGYGEQDWMDTFETDEVLQESERMI